MKKKILMILLVMLMTQLLPAQETEQRALKERISQLEKDVDKMKRENTPREPAKKTPEQKVQWGKTVALDIAAALWGRNSLGTLAIHFPRIKNFLSFGIRGAFASGYGPIRVKLNNNYVDLPLAMSISGGPFIITSSPLFFNFTRIYGGALVLAGRKFSPYGNDFGNNLSLDIAGFGGIEFYANKHHCFFIEVGGGPRLVFSDTEEGKASSNGGSFFNVGSRFYLAK